MSISQAKGIIRSLKWYHLGFCFFWAITFTALVNPSGNYADGYEAHSVCRQAVAVIALVVAAFYARRHNAFTPKSAIAAGIALSAGSLLYYLTFFYDSYSLVSALVSGVLVGGAMGAFYVMWQSFYASEGSSRTTIYIPLSAVASVVLCVLVSAIPFEWTVLCAVIVLPACAVYTLYVSLREVEPYEIEPMTPARSRMLVRDMWKPVFCVCAIGFVWHLVEHLVGDSDQASFVAIMAGMSAASLVVTAIELFSHRGFDILRVYQVLFPLVTGAFLLPTFLGATWLPVASGFTMFGFEVVNLLLLVTCAVYASRFAMHSSFIYAVCVGPTLFSLLLGDAVGRWLNRSTLYDLTVIVDILFVCIYVLSIAMFVISVGKGRKRDSVEAAAFPGADLDAASYGYRGEDARLDVPKKDSAARALAAQETPKGVAHPTSEANGEDEHDAQDGKTDAASAQASEVTLEDKLAGLELADPLSPRETEVAALVLRGNTVPAIARKLFISENTVRGHTKAIYRKLGVHSKQELIDLLG